MQPTLPWNPSGREEVCRMAPNELRRWNTVDYYTDQYHSDRQPNSRGGLPPHYSRHYRRHPNSRGAFPSNYSHHYHRRPNRRGGFPPSYSHHYFKQNNSKWKRRKKNSKVRMKKNNNMRGNPSVCTENERSNYLYHPPAPRNTTSFLVRARKNGGIAFDTPPYYTAIATPVNPNPSSHYAPGPDYPGDYIPTYRTISPNPSAHHRPELHPTSTSPVISGNPNPSPRLCDNNNHEEVSENLSPGSRVRRLQQENASLITRLKAMEMTLDNMHRRLRTLEYARPTFSENSIAY